MNRRGGMMRCLLNRGRSRTCRRRWGTGTRGSSSSTTGALYYIIKFELNLENRSVELNVSMRGRVRHDIELLTAISVNGIG